MGKLSVKHSSTTLGNIGQGSSTVFGHGVYTTNAGARPSAGTELTIKQQASTGDELNVGDIVKYVNICIEAGNRGIQPDSDDDNGWLEYGLMWENQGVTGPVTTSLGTQTLGDTLVKQYRGDCLWTGCMPIGSEQPNAVDLKIKLPKKASRIVVGSRLVLFVHFRSVNSTDLRSDSLRVLISSMFKSYS